MLDGIEVADDGYDQLFAGHRPQSHKSIIAVPSSPRGSPRAHGWTERPRRSTPSAIECQDVRVWQPDLDETPSHHEAVMAGATEMDGRDGEKFLVILRFTLTPISPPLYVLLILGCGISCKRSRIGE